MKNIKVSTVMIVGIFTILGLETTFASNYNKMYSFLFFSGFILFGLFVAIINQIEKDSFKNTGLWVVSLLAGIVIGYFLYVIFILQSERAFPFYWFFGTCIARILMYCFTLTPLYKRIVKE